MTPMKAIRLKCLDCCCGSTTEVRLCSAQECPLWAFRSGHRPTKDSTGASIAAQNAFVDGGFSTENGYGEGGVYSVL